MPAIARSPTWIGLIGRGSRVRLCPAAIWRRFRLPRAAPSARTDQGSTLFEKESGGVAVFVDEPAEDIDAFDPVDVPQCTDAIGVNARCGYWDG
jgi:hypothetical protein